MNFNTRWRRSDLDSTCRWDHDTQRRFWNDWNKQHLQENTLGDQANRRGQVVLNLIRSLGLRNAKILEIGCGNGWFAERLQILGAIYGVDISDESIAEARHRVPTAQFQAGNVLEVNLPTAFYDLVVSLETLSHVADQRRFMDVIAETLKQHGKVVIATQNRAVYLRRSDVRPPAPGQLRRWLTKRELSNLLRPHFECLRSFTVEPSGDLGFLRLLNSRKLNAVLMWFLPRQSIEKLKENLGFGQTLVVLAEKRD
jgi:SAM-dependent methyltransferase